MNKRIGGLLVDADAIGAGIYKLICERGEEAIVAFGMIPASAIEVLRKLLREKVIAEAAGQVEMSVEDFRPFVDEDKVGKLVSQIEHEVCVAIYGAAGKAGKMVV